MLHPRLGAFEPGAVGAGTEHELAALPQAVGQAVDERSLGPDDIQVGVDIRGRRRCRARNPRVARRHHDVSRPRQHVSEGVLAPTGANDADLHSYAARRTVWSRPGPTPT